MDSEIKFCPSCSLILEGGATHVDQGTCIQAMQVAMLLQKKVSEDQGLILTTRLMAIIEELCMNPDVGVEYKTCIPEDPNDPMGETVTELHHSQVVGVFEAIRTKFRAMGEWSPLTEAQDELFKEQQLNREFERYLQDVVDGGGNVMSETWLKEVSAFLRPDRQ